MENNNQIENKNNESKPLHFGFTKAQWRLFIVVLAIDLAAIFFHLLVLNDLNASAALYVGLPLLFALFLTLTPKSVDTSGSVFKGLTIAILLSAPIFKEGFLCILFASPIFYGIAGIVVYFTNRAKKKRAEKDSSLELSFVTVIIALSIASFEGVTEDTSFERYNTVSYSSIVNSSVVDIKNQLAQTPTFEKTRSIFVSLFPLPVKVEGQGLNVGDERRLHFVYNKWIFFNAHVGDTIFSVAEVKVNKIRFNITHDDSYLSHYLTWTNSEVLLEPINDKATKVTWTLSYIRKLDPIWYFGPMQQYAATAAAKTLIDNVATP